tara:strand:+ start:421 stop:1014 length:594 start_codon:yes stop_codon:yes gene_type:complete
MSGALQPMGVTHALCFNDARWLFAMFELQGNARKNMVCTMAPLPPGYYAVALSPSARTSVAADHAYRNEFKSYPGVWTFRTPTGRVVGLIKIASTCSTSDCKGDRWCEPAYRHANIISDVIPFSSKHWYVPVVGHLGIVPLGSKIVPLLSNLVKQVTAITAGKDTPSAVPTVSATLNIAPTAKGDIRQFFCPSTANE